MSFAWDFPCSQLSQSDDITWARPVEPEPTSEKPVHPAKRQKIVPLTNISNIPLPQTSNNVEFAVPKVRAKPVLQSGPSPAAKQIKPLTPSEMTPVKHMTIYSASSTPTKSPTSSAQKPSSAETTKDASSHFEKLMKRAQSLHQRALDNTANRQQSPMASQIALTSSLLSPSSQQCHASPFHSHSIFSSAPVPQPPAAAPQPKNTAQTISVEDLSEEQLAEIDRIVSVSPASCSATTTVPTSSRNLSSAVAPTASFQKPAPKLNFSRPAIASASSATVLPISNLPTSQTSHTTSVSVVSRPAEQNSELPQFRPALQCNSCGWNGAPRHDRDFHMQVLEIERDSTSDGQLLITLFGVTPYGNSVALRVSKFRPFLYLELPPNWDDMTISHAINNIKRELQIKTERAAYFASKNASEAASTSVAETESTFRARHVPANVQPNANAAMKIESFQIEKRKQLMGFSQSPLRLLKLIVNSPETVRAVQDIAIAGVDCSAAQKPNTFASTKSSTSFSANKPTSSTSSLVSLKVHESSVDVILRFCVDIDLLGCSWIRIPANHFRVRPLPFLSNADSKHGFNSSLKGAPKPFSSCQLEVETSVESIQSIVSEHQWSRVARLVVLSFDIECIGSDGAFPDATKIDNQLIQIGCSVMICGNADAREDDEKNKIAACSCCAPCYRCNHRKSSSECSFSKCESGAEKVDNRIVFKALFTSRPCSSIPGVAVHVVESESALLQAFAKFIIDVDPDVVTGYNIVNFDLPYVLNRVKLLKLPAEAATLGRFPNCKSVPQAISSNSRAHGARAGSRVFLPGRVVLDMLPLIQREHSLSSYTLNSVSEHFLKDQKEDVPHSHIATLFRGNPDDVARLGKYCVKDSVLPLRLMRHLCTLVNQIEMSRVTGVTLTSLVTRGQQYKVFAQICRHTHKHQYVVPYVPPPAAAVAPADKSKPKPVDLFGNHESDSESDADDEAETLDSATTYQGATVIDAETGMYFNPIVVCDFVSLYPSIMIAFNLSYETLLVKGRDDQMKYSISDDQIQDVELVPGQSPLLFMKPAEGMGILPTLLTNLLNARKKAKLEMKAATDPTMKQILNGRQLALKVSCNSIYGFCGAVRGGFLPCVPIAAAVTSIGRKLIDHTKDTICAHFTKANGYVSDSRVVYGDTDSVMINFRASMPNQVPNRSASTSTDASSDFVTNDADTAQMIRDAMELGTQAAKLVTDQLPAPIQLEFEKVYAPFMLFSKKRYAGLYYAANSDANRPNYMDVKGLQSVRRDSCTLLRETFDQCLNVLLRYSNIEAAREVVRRMLADMLARRVPMHSLILSRQLAKANYKGRQPHVELARRLAARDPASAPALGSRVSYVVLETGSAGKKSDLSDKVEDPLFALENDLPIDMQWYIEHQMKKPLTALFSLVLPNPNTLFSTINSGVDIVRKPAAMVHSMMRGFVQAQPRCVGCGCALSAGDAKRLCKTCAPRRESIVEPRRQQLVATEAQQKKLWQQCTACVGSSASQVVDLEDAADSLRLAKLCRNMDCHTLFERHQADRAFDRLAAELRDLES